MINMFEDKRKNIVTIIFTALYTVMLILNIDIHLSFLGNIRYLINSLIIYLIIYLMPLITPVLVLIFMLSKNKEYKFKKWLLPVAFGISALVSFVLLFSRFSVIDLYVSDFKHIVLLICSCLMFLSTLFMLIGTFPSFKYINFLKYGAFAYAVLYFISLIVDFIVVDGFAYLLSVPDGYSAINFLALFLSFTKILFYIGIFISITNKNPRV